MAIKRGSKVDKSFSSASMTDLIFLLLLFMLIATTLINPNAIKLITAVLFLIILVISMDRKKVKAC